MARVKGGTHAIKRRRKILREARGYRHGRSKKERLAREALLHAGRHAYRHRKMKKREMRRLWNIQINAGARTHSMSYSALMGKLAKSNIGVNRKILAELAQKEPEVFKKIIEKVKE